METNTESNNADLHKMGFTDIESSEYKNIYTNLLISLERFEENVYRDDDEMENNKYKGKATIGIGINIEKIGSAPIWRKLLFAYLFGITKQSNDIEFKTFDSDDGIKSKVLSKTNEKSVIKAYWNVIEYISTLCDAGLQTIAPENLQKHFDDSIENGIATYKANDNDDNKLSDEQLNFNNNTNTIKLNLSQAKELLDIMIIHFTAKTLNAINKVNKDIYNIFNDITKKSEKKYYKEFIPFVSATYQSPNIINNNNLLKQAFALKSRFLIWAIIRYNLGNNPRRRILQSAIFNLNNKTDNKIESDIEKFQTCIGIFKALNLYNNTYNKDSKQTYLEYFKSVEDKKAIESECNAYNNRNTNNKNGNFLEDPKYEIYRSGYINSSELKPLVDILNTYAEYINDIIDAALTNNPPAFESKQGFQKVKLKNSNNIEQTKEVRFALENIYVVDSTNVDKVEEAIKNLNATNNTNTKEDTKEATKENILIIITEELESNITLTQSNTTHLYIVSVCGNEINCSFLNNSTQNNCKENDSCRFLLLESKDNEKPKITDIFTKEIIFKQNGYNSLICNSEEYEYNIINNTIYVKKNNELILTLANYKYDLKESDV